MRISPLYPRVTKRARSLRTSNGLFLLFMQVYVAVAEASQIPQLRKVSYGNEDEPAAAVVVTPAEQNKDAKEAAA